MKALRELPAKERFDRVMNEIVLGMVCDGNGPRFRCGLHPTWAPRVVVPPVAIGDPPGEFRALRMMTALHYCDMHFAAFNVADFLDAARKRDFERVAAAKRGHGYRCDFEQARIERVRIDTPEYRAFIASLATRRNR